MDHFENKNDNDLYFCFKCDIYMSNLEKIDHVLSHEIEKNSNENEIISSK